MNLVLTGLLPAVVPELTFLLVMLADVVALLSGSTPRGERSRVVDQTCRSTGVPPRELQQTVRVLSRSRPVPARLGSLVPLAQPIAITVLQIEARAYGRIRRLAPIILPIAAGLLLLSIVAAVIGGDWVLPVYLVGICAVGITLIELAYLWMAPRMISRRLSALQRPPT